MRRGNETIAERRALLEAHRDEVAAKLAEQQALLEVLERKGRMYQEHERERARAVMEVEDLS